MRFPVLLLSLALLLPCMSAASGNPSRQPSVIFPNAPGGTSVSSSQGGGYVVVPSMSQTPVSPTMRDRLANEAAKPRASGGWSRPGVMGGNTAIYLSFTGGTADDRLLSVSTAWARKSELHETVVDTQGVVRMLPALSGFELPARQRVVFAPGGKHVMVMGLKRELREGQSFPVNLTFEKAGLVRVMVQVRRAAAGTSVPSPDAAASKNAEDHSGHAGHH